MIVFPEGKQTRILQRETQTQTSSSNKPFFNPSKNLIGQIDDNMR